MILSICIVTMNRAKQLKRAIDSCLVCNLPPKAEWELVVVDNASVDETEYLIQQYIEEKCFNVKYIKLGINKGVGGGRNIAFDNSSGKYIYVLDDDAIIDAENENFFIDAIECLEINKSIASLTTQIFDEALEKNRIEPTNVLIADGIYRCFMFCGGSHFLRKEFWGKSPYLDNKYGLEELPPSLYAVSQNMENAYIPKLRVIHQPVINKWKGDSSFNLDIALRHCVLNYEIKKRLYPIIFIPVCYLAYVVRMKKHLGNRRSIAKINEIKREIQGCSFQRQLSVGDLCRLFFWFGVSVF